ncbi:hypothetical protein WR25_10665 [Diploscapter pachys]|uniref:ribonuclease Z n=1 Tax=Diploscapter pachys TaxID=2018661 RepID=A0A2A2L4S4_9BILA|nr:hypothetical protein WR25_10665 [Diploscapter pachys]
MKLLIRTNSSILISAVWDNISGISAILLAKDPMSPLTRIHGSTNTKHYLNTIRPFVDSDTGSNSVFSKVDELPYSNEVYEDAALRVTYIPLVPSKRADSSQQSSGEHQPAMQGISIAYYVELKEPPRNIDPLKLVNLKIPRGPWIAKLKAGESITLEDGRTIRPEQVFSDEEKKIVDADGLGHCIHMGLPAVVNSPLYQRIFQLLPRARHLITNQEAPFVPFMEGIYKLNRLMTFICPAVFPPIYPLDWNHIVAQNSELAEIRQTDGAILAAPLQKMWMREGKEEPIVINLGAGEIEDMERITDKVKQMVEQVNQESASLPPDCPYPAVSFLGTSSATPSKYRNVSAYLVEANPHTAWLVDVGEGTYYQLVLLFGEERVKQVLVNLRAIFVTHAHQDHMNGMFMILQQRKAAFESLGLEYQPIVLVANRNVLKPLKTYSLCFEDLTHLVEIVDISQYSAPPPDKSNANTSNSPSEISSKRRRTSSPTLPPCRDLVHEMPKHIFDADKWGLDSIKCVMVHHTRMANGFVFQAAGKKIVFSGDTKPCELLAKEGLGADLLVHEATFGDAHAEDALRKKHSTMNQAVEIGRKMQAKWIILTHFSARYPKVPALPDYLDTMGNVGVALDFMRVPFDKIPILPKFIPLFRELFGDELFDIELKNAQRTLKNKEEERGRDLDVLSNRNKTMKI